MCVFILSIVTTQGVNEYNQTGNSNSLFSGGSNIFATGDAADTFKTKLLSDPHYIPMVNDMDLNGENEIIVIDGPEVKIWQGSNLIFANSLLLNYSTDRISNAIIFDIDGDLIKNFIGLIDGSAELVIQEVRNTLDSFYTV